MFKISRKVLNITFKSVINIRQCHVDIKSHYDIIIGGGGMIGGTLACTLAKNPKLSATRILLLEGGPEKTKPLTEKYSNRVSAINPQTKELLERIGVWKHVTDYRYAPVKRLQVWDALSDAMITFNDDTTNISAYIVENDLLLNSVGKELQNAKNVTVIYNSKISEYELPIENDYSTVKLENGNKYEATLLLGCDGFNSQVRKTMGTHYLSWDYDQMGIVATLTLKEEIENVVAWQRFLPTGPIALLPLTNKLSSLVWTTKKQHAKHLLNLSGEDFVEAVNEAIWKEYKKDNLIKRATETVDEALKFLNLPSNAVRQLPPTIIECETNSRAAFPLGFGHASNYITKGVALVGDAAHRIHPLAGQGVNLGFGDIVTLEKLLAEAAYSGEKLGNLSVLKKYETERQKHNLPTMFAVDGLKKLYDTEFTPLVLLRSVGLQITNAIAPLKNTLIKQAST